MRGSGASCPLAGDSGLSDPAAEEAPLRQGTFPRPLGPGCRVPAASPREPLPRRHTHHLPLVPGRGPPHHPNSA